MYKIGDFSRITKLSIKTLHYYDEEGLLKPSFRNAENEYRYYNQQDFERAEMLVFLRSLAIFTVQATKRKSKISKKTNDKITS